MKKRALILFLTTMTAASILFSGCSKKEEETTPVAEEAMKEIDTSEPEEIEPVEEPEPEVEKPIIDNNISENWMDGEFLMDGVKVSLPCPYKELAELGWILNIDRSEEYLMKWINKDGSIDEENSIKNDFTIDPGQYYNTDAIVLNEKHPGDYIIVGIYNPSDKELDIEDCVVTSLMVTRDIRNTDNNESLNITLPKEITYGSSEQEILEAFGEPSDYDKDPIFTWLTYTNDDTYFRVELTLEEGKDLTDISLFWDEFHMF